MASSSLAIKLNDVGVRYQQSRSLIRRVGGFEALRNIDLDLLHGEKLGIVGRNGAGKSTLLKVLADVLKPDVGRVERHHRSCRLLALGTGFMPNLTGRENAVLSGLILGMDRRQIVSRLEHVMEFSELGDFFDQPVRTYSSGMRSRLGFSIAIQQQPDVLLIDETLAVGDAAFNAKCIELLRGRMLADIAVVIVSHSAKVISDLCTRAVWIDKGAIVCSGQSKDVLERYKQGQ